MDGEVSIVTYTRTYGIQYNELEHKIMQHNIPNSIRNTQIQSLNSNLQYMQEHILIKIWVRV